MKESRQRLVHDAAAVSPKDGRRKLERDLAACVAGVSAGQEKKCELSAQSLFAVSEFPCARGTVAAGASQPTAMNLRLLISAAAIGVTAPLSAATANWFGGTPAGPDNWSLSQNWVSAIPPQNNDAVFAAGVSFIGMMQHTDASVNTLLVTAPGFGFNNSGIAGSTLTVAAGITVTFAGTGITTFDTPVKAGGSQTWAMNGSRGTILWNEPVDLNGKTVTLDGNGIQEFNGSISGAGNFIKTGTGRVQVNSALTGGGGINVQDGVMIFHHAVNTKTVQMSAPGIVSGGGTVTSLTGSSGTVRPGLNAPGILTVAGSLLLSGTAVVEMEIKGSTVGTGYDRLSVGSAVSLGGSSLSVTVGSGFVPVPGTVLTIIEKTGAGAVNGTFSGLPQGADLVVGNVTFAISYTGGDGNDVTLTVLLVAATGVERVWTGAVDSLWSTPGNWAAGIVPQPGDSVQFPELAATKKTPHNDLPVGYPINLIRLTAGGYSLGGSGLTLSDGIVQQATPGAAENKVTLALVTALGIPPAAQITRLKLQSGGPLSLLPLADFLLTHPDSELRLENDQPAVQLTCAASCDGPGFISKAGTGPAILTTPSSHTGGVKVTGGTLIAAVSGTPGTGVIEVTAPGVLSLGTVGGGAQAFSNAMTLSGTVQSTPGSGTQTCSGPVELISGQTANVITAGGALVFSGVISGDGALSLSGGTGVSFSGPQPNTWSGGISISGILVICNKSAPGTVAIPCDVTVSGHIGALHVPHAGQIASTAELSVLARASVSFTGAQSLAGLTLDSGTVYAGPALTVTGNLTASATLSPSEIQGTLLTGPTPVTWLVNGPASPGLRITGSIGHTGGSIADITKAGAGLLQVNDAPGSTHTGLLLTLTSGTLEWNDSPDGAGDFGPVILINGGVLRGEGQVRQISSLSGGHISPGGGTGVLTSGQTELRENVTFLAEWTGSGDRLAVQGTLALNNAALFLSGSEPAYGTPWMLVENDGADPVSGHFAGLPEGATLTTDGALLRISYTGGDGNDVVLTRLVPEAPVMSSFDIGGALPGSGGSVTGEGAGLPGFTYALEYSSDLTAWTEAVDATADGTGAFHFTWTPGDFPPRRFFRVSAR